MVRPVVKNTGRQGFPGSSAGKESTCSAGDPGSIPGLGRSTGEGIGYPLQYSGLEHSMDYSPWVTKSWTQLSHAAGRCCCLKLPKNPHHPCCPGFFLQALQISLQSNDSTAPAPGMVFPGSGRLPLGTGIRETRGDMERGRGRDQRRVSSQGQRTLRVVSCVGGFISPLHYYLKDKAVLSNSRGSIFPLCSHYLENSQSLSTETTLPVTWRPWRREGGPAFGKSQRLEMKTK